MSTYEDENDQALFVEIYLQYMKDGCKFEDAVMKAHNMLVFEKCVRSPKVNVTDEKK